MDLIYNEIPTAFPWYDKLQKQRRFTENAANNCDYKLISPDSGLLPFQFVVPAGFAQPIKWEIMTECNELAIDISTNIPALSARETQTGIYVYYRGEDLKFNAVSGIKMLVIPEGTYYSKITFANGTEMFSELFTSTHDLSQFVKLEFWNGCDLQPIMYNAINWKQLIYLDTFIHTGEPEIEEDGERDGDDTLIPTFQKMTIKYKFTSLVPDFLKIAITSMQIHEEVYLTTGNGVRTGKIERMTTTATVESGGAYSTVDVSLEQLIMSRDACCENMVVEDSNPWGV